MDTFFEEINAWKNINFYFVIKPKKCEILFIKTFILFNFVKKTTGKYLRAIFM